MTRFYATLNGNLPFTAEEEAYEDAKAASPTIINYDYEKQLIRNERNQQLKECDWKASVDVTMTDEWKAYRQELRDVPQHPDFPQQFIDDNGMIVLPSPPAN